jgi:hypothetical protein
MVKKLAGVLVGVFVVGITHASAQVIAWEDRAFVNVSGGGQGGSRDINKQFAFSLYEENATVDARRNIKGGGFFDLTAGYRIRGNWGAGFSFTRRSSNNDGALTGSIPDQILFERPRSVTSSVAGMKYSETLFAPLFVYTYPMTDKIDVMLLTGPSVGRVTHEIVTDIAVSEGSGGPVLTASRQTIKKSFVGFQGGVDVRYLFTRQLGAGVFMRYNGASGNLNSEIESKIGGFQVGGGLRVRF